jgi:hypothetical protein
LFVTEGSNVISPFRCFLIHAFFSILLCVSVKLSFLGDVFGLNVGLRLSMICLAVCAHLLGFLQPANLFSMQAWHTHFAVFSWVLLLVSRLAISRRSLTVFALWIFCRHLSLVLWYVPGGAPRWYHAGSWFLSSSDSFSGAKLTLCFLLFLVGLRLS